MEESPLTGYLSFYYSDPSARLPVREVTRPNDCKSDPNVETGTYGLFSSCERGMRVGLVRYARPYIFFVTRRREERVLSGYYHIKWWAPATPLLANGARGKARPDYSLAADVWRFIDPPLSLRDLSRRPGAPDVSKSFRLCKGVGPRVVEFLRRAVNEHEDRTADYVAEIKRLELVNRRFTGLRYPNWGRLNGFGWEFAASFLAPIGGTLTPEEFARIDLETRAGVKYWECVKCSWRTRSNSPLRLCSHCNAAGTQKPVWDD